MSPPAGPGERWQRSELAQAFPIQLSNSPLRRPVLNRSAERVCRSATAPASQGKKAYHRYWPWRGESLPLQGPILGREHAVDRVI
jgi:hypothetical protein